MKKQKYIPLDSVVTVSFLGKDPKVMLKPHEDRFSNPTLIKSNLCPKETEYIGVKLKEVESGKWFYFRLEHYESGLPEIPLYPFETRSIRNIPSKYFCEGYSTKVIFCDELVDEKMTVITDEYKVSMLEPLESYYHLYYPFMKKSIPSYYIFKRKFGEFVTPVTYFHFLVKPYRIPLWKFKMKSFEGLDSIDGYVI